MIDTDVEKWLNTPKADTMIEIQIDEKNKAVYFNRAVNFEKAQLIVQCLMDGFGWARQDVTFGHLNCGPTVEPGAPVPIPGVNTFPLAPSAGGTSPVFDHNGNPVFYNQPVVRYPCAGEPILCRPGGSLIISDSAASDGINITTTEGHLTYTVNPHA